MVHTADRDPAARGVSLVEGGGGAGACQTRGRWPVWTRQEEEGVGDPMQLAE